MPDPIKERARTHERNATAYSLVTTSKYRSDTKTMKLSSAAIALALAAGGASAQDNADTAAILANWG